MSLPFAVLFEHVLRVVNCVNRPMSAMMRAGSTAPTTPTMAGSSPAAPASVAPPSDPGIATAPSVGTLPSSVVRPLSIGAPAVPRLPPVEAPASPAPPRSTPVPPWPVADAELAGLKKRVGGKETFRFFHDEEIARHEEPIAPIGRHVHSILMLHLRVAEVRPAGPGVRTPHPVRRRPQYGALINLELPY